MVMNLSNPQARARLGLGVVAVAVLLSACASGPQVRVNLDNSAEFSQ